MTRVAFLGVGTMGRHLVRHLAAAGHAVTAYDVSAAALGEAEAAGCAVAGSIAEACADAEAAFLSLPSPALVEQVADEAAAALPDGALLVDVSTSPPALARELADRHEPRLRVVDCPLSGGPVGAEAGTLSSMLGGDEAACAAVEPLAATWSSFVVRTGGHGTGQAAKLCNNLLAGTHMAALCLSLALARRAGLDDAVLYEILSRSTGDSRVLRARYPAPGVDDAHPANRDFEPLFTVDLMTKDVELAEAFAREAGLDASLLDAVIAIYHEAQAEGLGGLDYSGLINASRTTEASK
jgi:3-hydroxyisobutyrate dehydrogenase